MVKNYDNMVSRFHTIPERNGRTDRRTERPTDKFAISISHVSMLTRDKKQRRRPMQVVCFTKHRSILLVVASVHTCDIESRRRRRDTHDQSCVAR